jgi:Mrp family chromosome partitioning ATPase
LCIGIASFDEGVGVTTIAARLAAQAAENGMGNILLVDANHNKPSVHRHFRLGRGPGLLNHLCEGLELTECIQKTDDPDLHILTLGSKDMSTRSVSPLALKPLFFELRSRYQLVIVDLPVIESVGYGLFFATQADGVVLVLDGAKSRARSAKQLVQLLKENNVSVIGAVLNRYVPALPKWLRSFF